MIRYYSVPLSVFLLISGVFLMSSCKQKSSLPYLFELKDDQSTGLHFENKLTPTQSFNVFDYMYFFNGAGVGAGDFNNDGKIDIFFAASQGDNQLYLNQGGLKFKDVTREAMIPQDGGWSNRGISG